MYRTILSSKGQIVIPADVRKRLGLKPGTGMTLEVQGDRVLLVPDSSLDWRKLRGSLPKSPALEDLQRDRDDARKKGAWR